VTLYTIKASGCDDETVVVLDLTPGQAVTVEEVAKAITEVLGGCMPTLSIAATSFASDEVPF
jgi:ribosome biogenesis SPOUT family RNA methylase Rps3